MSDIAFHLTQMGHRYYLRDVPELVMQLKLLNTNLERIAALLERREPTLPGSGE